MTVAWQLPSHVNAAVVMLALARMPVMQAPVLHLYRRREVCAALEVARADILVVDESTAANARTRDTYRHGASPTLVRPISSRRRPARPHPELDRPHSADEPRWVYFTSGTTGRPKAVRHSDATLLSAGRGYAALSRAWAATRTKSARSPFPSRTSAAWSISPPLCSATFRCC